MSGRNSSRYSPHRPRLPHPALTLTPSPVIASPPVTTPDIAEITVSETENLVYLRKAGDAGFDGLQSLDDLRHNWNRLLDAAGLTEEERHDAVRLFNSKVAAVPGTKL